MSGDEAEGEEPSEGESYAEVEPHGVYQQEMVQDEEQGPEDDDGPDGEAEEEEAESGDNDPREEGVKEALLAFFRSLFDAIGRAGQRMASSRAASREIDETTIVQAKKESRHCL